MRGTVAKLGIRTSNVFSIRKAGKDDARAAWHIRNAAIMIQCTGHYPSQSLELWTRGEMTDEFVSAVVGSFYVATLDGQVVGTGMIDLESGKVDAIFVHPKQMGTGIGRRIVSYLEDLAIEAGLSLLHLDSTLNAASFYRACGFVGETVCKYESPRGLSLDCIPMKKSLPKFGR
jgi:GNAT superfamily N-acetyltransferase